MTLRCAEVRDLLHPFLDGELDVDRNVLILKHFELCAACSERSHEARALRDVLARCAPEACCPDERDRLVACALDRGEASDVGTCAGVRDVLAPFVDGELDVDRSVPIVKHLEACGGCRARAGEAEALRDVVARSAREACPPLARARLVSAALSGRSWRVGAPQRRALGGGLLRGLLLRAAAVLLLAGGASTLALDPFCWRGCPVVRALTRTHRATTSVALLSPEDLSRCGGGSAPCLVAAGARLEGGTPVVLDCGGAPEGQRLVRYRCESTGQALTLLRLPGGHVHPWLECSLADGRCYFVDVQDGTRFVGWIDDAGALCCLMGDDDVPMERLTQLARAARGE